MSKHKILWCRGGTDHNGSDWEDEQVITFEFRRRAPEQGPSYASGGQPADPDEVEFVSATATLHTLDVGMQAMLDDWGREYLGDAGYSDACAAAEDDNTSAREDAADYRRRAARDDALTERGR